MKALFKEPFDCAEIYVLIWQQSSASIRFLKAAILLCGREDRWRASLEQLGRLRPEWDASPWPDEPLYDLLGALGLRYRRLAQWNSDRRPPPIFRELGFDSDRVNAAARRIIVDQPDWYPCQLPLSQDERKYWQRRDGLPEDR